MNGIPLFERMTVIGLGMIGSSVARAVREHQLANIIIGCDYNEISLAYGRKHGFIDMAVQDPLSAVTGSQLVIIATPPASFSDIARAIAPNLQPGALIMDTGSVKETAMKAIMPYLPDDVDFIPTHPIAGSEHTGVGAGRADLFDGKRVIVTPEEPLRDHLMQVIIKFWQTMGAKVEGMPAPLHDMIYAYVSHLPHLLAFAASNMLGADVTTNDEALGRFLRLGNSSADLWVDIFTQNKDNLLKALNRYLDVVIHISKELKQAPAEEASLGNDPQLVRTVLFPRIAASCLVTTVMEASKQAGFSFARYAGSGFADFTHPASIPPEDDIERISSCYAEVGLVIDDYIAVLRQFRQALTDDDAQLDRLLS